MRLSRPTLGFAALTVAAALALSGCGAGEQAAAQEDTLHVVSSTNVYGDIAQAVGGDLVSVHSIISKAGADPHSYESNAQDKLAVSQATVGIENGGGYDDFYGQLTHGVLAEGQSVNVSALSGLETDDHFNEHLWYSLPTMATLADELATRFAAAQPADEATFTANAATFKTALTGLSERLSALGTAHAGTGVAITEPVPLYLLEQAGLTNLTPDDFSEAVEHGSDVPPLVLADTVALMGSGEVRLLAYNVQTEGAQSIAVKDAAEAAGVPVLDFSETLPENMDYVQWMDANITQLEQALVS